MKKTTILKFVATLLCLALCASSVMALSNGLFAAKKVAASDLDDVKQEKEDKEQQRKDVQKKMDEYKASAQDTKEYMVILDTQMSELNGSMYELQIKMEDLNTQIDETTQNLEAAQEDAASQYEMMKLRIKFMYEHNEESYLALILTSESMGEMLNRAEYVTKISSYDRDMLTKYEETIKYIAEAKQQLEDDYTELADTQSQLESQRDELAQMQAEKESELANYNSLIASSKAQETELSSDISGLTSEIERIERELEEQNRNNNNNNGGNSGGSTDIPSTGVFLWPTISRRITSDYGDTDGRTSPHIGIDIGATTPGVWGDPIYAADGGRVVRAEYNRSAGNWLWIDHGNGLYSIYMHCSQFLVSIGQTVNRGDKIALMGSTGESTGAHLHFSVRYGGTYVNPWGYLR